MFEWIEPLVLPFADEQAAIGRLKAAIITAADTPHANIPECKCGEVHSCSGEGGRNFARRANRKFDVVTENAQFGSTKAGWSAAANEISKKFNMPPLTAALSRLSGLHRPHRGAKPATKMRFIYDPWSKLKIYHVLNVYHAVTRDRRSGKNLCSAHQFPLPKANLSREET